MRVITWRYLQIKLGWENERRGKGGGRSRWTARECGSGTAWKSWGREKERAGKLIRISVLLGFSGGSRLEGISNRQGPRFAPRTATWIDPHAYFWTLPCYPGPYLKSRVCSVSLEEINTTDRARHKFSKKLRSVPGLDPFEPNMYFFFLSAARITIHPRPALIALDGRKWNSIFIRLRDFPQGEGRGGQPTHARARSPFISGFLSKRRPSATGIKFNKFED